MLPYVHLYGHQHTFVSCHSHFFTGLFLSFIALGPLCPLRPHSKHTLLLYQQLFCVIKFSTKFTFLFVLHVWDRFCFYSLNFENIPFLYLSIILFYINQMLALFSNFLQSNLIIFFTFCKNPRPDILVLGTTLNKY